MEDTLLTLLNKSVKYLENKGVHKPRFVVEKILSEILSLDRISLYSNFERILSSDEKKMLKDKLINYDDNKKDEIILETIRDYYEKTKIYLDKKGIDESNIITNIIFSNLLNIDMSLLFTKYSNSITEDQKNRLRDILKKIVDKKIPIQYIFNEQVFYGYSFYVDKNVLIPRIDTEVVVEKALELINKINNPKVLDIGTGSGAIALVIGLENRESKILATDISENALKIAKKNSEILNVENVKFLHSDLFSEVSYKEFDLIVSNPPYISRDEIGIMGENVLLHEPQNALFAEDGGLYFYFEISKNAKNHLKNDGYLLFEIGYSQVNKVKDIMENMGYIDVSIGKDLTGNERYVFGRKKGS
ncbi:peptide chain release factor N(5)-glutamine methyltransferase [Streptobacillus moniliformis]|uniref:peptide chain release factor N(5)-glutamine methyltransferase n=1 Tax=Streptobacillus moniliformis TaxID=34105 RepID=UPI0007E45E56|nr:peptide chain release factor N(5)-glutamine methyltransferase [Streptobacillus moniliformis]